MTKVQTTAKRIKRRLDDTIGKNHVTMEVGFSTGDDLKDSIKVTMDGKEAIIKISDLYAFVFTIVDDKAQEDLIPVKKVLMRKLVRQHVIEATKDLKAGETIVARCETDIPVEVWKAALLLKGKSQIPVEEKK